MPTGAHHPELLGVAAGLGGHGQQVRGAVRTKTGAAYEHRGTSLLGVRQIGRDRRHRRGQRTKPSRQIGRRIPIRHAAHPDRPVVPARPSPVFPQTSARLINDDGRCPAYPAA
jgi:hypothetical protein